MKRAIYLLFATSLLIVLAFTLNKPEPKTEVDSYTYESFPQLLDRNAKLTNGIEWDQVQNQYVANRNAIIQKTEDPEPYYKLAEVFVLEARVTGEHGHYYPAALEMLNQMLEHPETDTDQKFRALSLQAGVQLSLHNFKEALEIAQEAVKINPYNAQIYGALVDAHVDAVTAGYPGYEETAWARLTLGGLYEKAGEDEKAEFQYQTILAERFDYPFAIAALAGIEMKKGEMEKADSLLQVAIDIIPEVGFYIQLAELYQQTDRKDEMEALIPEIVEMFNDDIAHGHNMNLEYANMLHTLAGDHKGALDKMLIEYQIRPDNDQVNFQLARIYSAMNENELARKHLQKAKRIDSTNPDILKLQEKIAMAQ